MANVLHNNRVKFPKDFVLFCSVHQYGGDDTNHPYLVLVDVSSHSVEERNILQTILLSFFFSFYFLNALQIDNSSNTVYVLEHYFGPFSELI